MNATLGTGWNDVLSSFRVVYNDSVSADSVSLTVSGNTATPSYTFTTTSDLTESGSTYTYFRANDGSGNGAATIGTSKVWTLTVFDLDKYPVLRHPRMAPPPAARRARAGPRLAGWSRCTTIRPTAARRPSTRTRYPRSSPTAE